MTTDEMLDKMEDCFYSDSDVLLIDNDCRCIAVPLRKMLAGVTSDDDVNQIKFQMPRMYGDTDLAEFEIRINYLNANGDGDAHIVENKEVSDDTINFAWVVGRNALKYKGTIRFVVCMRKLDDEGVVQQEFNTRVAELRVAEGLETDTTSEIEEEYEDILLQIFHRFDSLKEDLEAADVAEKALEEDIAAAGAAEKSLEEDIATAMQAEGSLEEDIVSAGIAAESLQKNTESAEQINQQLKANNEIAESAEEKRIQAEAERASAEEARATAEEARAQAEVERNASEESREEAEKERAAAETIRIENEAARVSAEAARQTASAQAVENANAATETLLAQVNQIAFSLNESDGGLDIIIYETEGA